MNLAPTEEQRLLAESARAVVARDCPTDVVRAAEASEVGFDAGLWKTAGALGWAGLVLPEDVGGSGRGLADFTVLAEALGSGLFPTPLLTSTTLVALPLSWAGTAAQQEQWLPALAAGEAVGALGLVALGARDEWGGAGLVGRRANGGWVLDGRVTLVPYADTADLLLLAVDLQGSGLSLVAIVRGSAGVTMRRLDVTGGEPLSEVTVEGLVVGDDAIVGTPGGARPLLDRALDHAAVATLAFLVGAAERALALTVEHAQAREQFGRPIGSFQAVAHRCADMRTDVDACRFLAYRAAWALDEDVDVELAVGAAKAYGNDALRRVFQHAHQVHGAVGFSTEHDLHLFTRRAKAFELTYGGTARHRERVAGAMGL